MVEIRISEISSLLIKAWEPLVGYDSASYMATKVISTHLGKWPRINPLKECIGDLEKCRRLENIIIFSERKSNNSRVYDFNGVPGIAYLKDLNDEVVNMAKEGGIGIIGIRNTGGIHTLDTWVSGIAEKDCIGIFMWNGGPYVTVPYGGSEAFWGTNPLAYSIPTMSEPIISDMATSEIAYMDLMRAIKSGNPLLVGQGLDEDGKPTTDPNKVFIPPDSARLLPLGGGYKGSAIVFLIEILTGALVEGKMGHDASNIFRAEEFGGLLIGIDINSFTTAKKFKEDVSRMAQLIRDSKPAFGFEKVKLPGDNTYQHREEITRNGIIDIDDDLIQRLKC